MSNNEDDKKWGIPKKALYAGRIVEIQGGRGGLKYHVLFPQSQLRRGINPAHERLLEVNNSAAQQKRVANLVFNYNDDVLVNESGKYVKTITNRGVKYVALAFPKTALEHAPRGVYAEVPHMQLEANEGNAPTIRVRALPKGVGESPVVNAAARGAATPRHRTRNARNVKPALKKTRSRSRSGSRTTSGFGRGA